MTIKTVKYDDASWHSEGDYPKGLPMENAATHIGMFFAWAILRGLAGEEHKKRSKKELAAVKKRKMTGAEFLLRMCDGKLTNEDLNDLGNRFATAYYDKQYYDDYCDALEGTTKKDMYHFKDTWKNFNLVKPIIDKRFLVWKKSNSKSVKAKGKNH